MQKGAVHDHLNMRVTDTQQLTDSDEKGILAGFDMGWLRKGGVGLPFQLGRHFCARTQRRREFFHPGLEITLNLSNLGMADHIALI